MNLERFQIIEELSHAAVALDPADRGTLRQKEYDDPLRRTPHRSCRRH